jgi:hypothetical protein
MISRLPVIQITAPPPRQRHSGAWDADGDLKMFSYLKALAIIASLLATYVALCPLLV